MGTIALFGIFLLRPHLEAVTRLDVRAKNFRRFLKFTLLIILNCSINIFLQGHSWLLAAMGQTFLEMM